MSKMFRFLEGETGPTVVWVDDRALLSQEECRLITQDKGQSVESLNSSWATAVVEGTWPTMMFTGTLQNFAEAASMLMSICREMHCNLVLTDFRTAHAEKLLAGSENIFLLDLQDDTGSLGASTLSDGSTDAAWNKELYGARCVEYYGIPKARYRFITRYRSLHSDDVKGILSHQFDDDSEVYAHSLRLDDLTSLNRNLRKFLDDTMVHESVAISSALLWFSGLPLTDPSSPASEEKERAADANHNSLGEGDALGKIRKSLGSTAFSGESAKGLFHSSSPWACIARPNGYLIRKDDVLLLLKHLDLRVDMDLPPSTKQLLKLPCQPGLSFLISLKALSHAMEHCDKFLPPTRMTLSVTKVDATHVAYQLALLLAPRDRENKDVTSAAGLRKGLTEVEANQATPGTRITSRRLVDLKWCRVQINAQGRNAIVCGADKEVVIVEFPDNPLSILLKWEAVDENSDL